MAEGRGDGPPQAMVACWNSAFGYGAIFEPHVQLDRALGSGNVQMRVRPAYNMTLLDWPQRAGQLGRYDLVVITDLPAVSFTEKQLKQLRQYVTAGGALVLMGSMTGWKHDPPDAWWTSALGDFMPMAQTPAGEVAVRRITPAATDHPLLRGLPLGAVTLNAWSRVTGPTPGATVIATIDGGPFIAEKKAGEGTVIQITGKYAHKATQVPIPSFNTDFFMSPYYSVFWDNLVEYVTGKPAPAPRRAAVPKPKPGGTVLCDVIRDNYGDVFAPGAIVQLRPDIQDNVDHPIDVEAFLEGGGAQALPVGRYSLKDAADVLRIELPYLDRGRYTLRLDLRRAGDLVATAGAPLAVVLPPQGKDAFAFTVLLGPDYLGETDITRTARELKSIGFTGVGWLGGHIYGSYDGQYRVWNRSRFASRMQEAGLNTEPVWYPYLLSVLHGRSGPRPTQAG